MIPRERILVTVKTYPELSRTYGETVCTAGLREDGTWVRLYPVPFRRLDESEQYKLYDWIECRLRQHTADSRPESFRPVDVRQLVPVGHLDTSEQWRERRQMLLHQATVHTSLAELIQGAKNNALSLAVFKPRKVIDFQWEETDRHWNPDSLAVVRAMTGQPDLFDDTSWTRTFQIVDKLPYNFYYRFEDHDGRSARLRVLEWQIGALYRNCLRSSNGDEGEALVKVRQKYLDDFLETDLHFFLGTTAAWHRRAPNPWMIVGVAPIPHVRQRDFFNHNDTEATGRKDALARSGVLPEPGPV